MPGLASLRLCFSFLRPASDLTKDIIITISPEIKASENVVLVISWNKKERGRVIDVTHV